MTDTRDWIRQVRRVQPPELWREAEERASRAPLGREPEERRRLRALVILVASVAVVGSAIFALSGLGSGSRPQPAAGHVTRYRLDGAPQPIAVGEGAAWVDVTSISPRGTGPSMISRIDAETGTVTPLPDTLGAVWVTTGEGAVWATCNAPACGGSGVLELDPTTGALVRTISIPDRVNQITIGLGSVWASTESGLTRIDPSTGSIADTFPGHYDEIGVGGSSIWAMTGGGVISVDPTTGEQLGRVAFPNPCNLEATQELVFLSSCGGMGHETDELLGIDASTGRLLYRVPLSGYGNMRLSGNTLWIAENDANHPNLIRLVPLDARTGEGAGVPLEIVRGTDRFSLEHMFPAPSAFFSIGEGSAWLSDFDAGEVIRVVLPAPLAPSQTPSDVGHVVSVTRTLTRAPGVLCTASMPSVVEPGAPLGLKFTLENRSSLTVNLPSFPPSYPFTITAGDGTNWDAASLMNHSWPAPGSEPLAPGATKTIDPQPVRVQFPGPLTVRPTCDGERMPPLTVGVDGGGGSVPDEEAVSRAASATSGLLDRCAPPPGGSAVGTITPPKAVGGSPTMEGRCAATVATHQGFSIVTFVISTPADAPTPSVGEGFLTTVGLSTNQGNAETIVWRFVVTDATVVPVASFTHTRTVAGGGSEFGYDVSSHGWSHGDQSTCGGEGYGFGGDGRTVYIIFPDSCVQR